MGLIQGVTHHTKLTPNSQSPYKGNKAGRMKIKSPGNRAHKGKLKAKIQGKHKHTTTTEETNQTNSEETKV